MTILSDCADYVVQRLSTQALPAMVTYDERAVRVRVIRDDGVARDFNITRNEAEFSMFPCVDALIDATQEYLTATR